MARDISAVVDAAPAELDDGKRFVRLEQSAPRRSANFRRVPRDDGPLAMNATPFGLELRDEYSAEPICKATARHSDGAHLSWVSGFVTLYVPMYVLVFI